MVAGRVAGKGKRKVGMLGRKMKVRAGHGKVSWKG